MVKFILKFFFVLIATNYLEAKKIDSDENEKIYNLSICAILSNDLEILIEWIEYHRLIGVDHFYLYNISEKNLKKKLSFYLNQGLITLVDWHQVNEELEEDYVWALSSQVSAYENAILISSQETKWLIFLEINEFLVTSDLSKTLQDYHEKPALRILSSFHEYPQIGSKKGLIIENFNIAKPPLPRPQKEVSKVIFKPDQCKGFSWPPYECKFISDQKPLRLSKSELRINKYISGCTSSMFNRPSKGKIELDQNLVTQDITNQLLDDGYEIEDQESVIKKYVPKLLEKMGMFVKTPSDECEGF